LDAALDIEELRTRFGQGEIAGVDYYPTLDLLRARHRSLEKQAERVADRWSEIERESTADSAWSGWNLDQRRAFVRDHVVTVIVHPAKSRGVGAQRIHDGEIEIIWKHE